VRPGRASRTAEHNALFRALEARRPRATRVADDPLAARFLGPGFRAVAEVGRVTAVRRLLERAIDDRWPCVRAGVVVRTRLIDDTVAAQLSGVEQVLILGAGFDTRAWRLPGMSGMAVFEVDHPATQSAKRRALSGLGPAPGHVTFVPVVFGSDDPARALAERGFRTGVQTVVVWEGTTNYLDSFTVASTFAFLAGALGSGSPVVFTYVDRRMLDGSARFAGASTTLEAVRRVGEPFTFGLDPGQVPGYLTEHGFALEWDTAVCDAAGRFYTAQPAPLAPAYYRVALASRV
jgi:methyltransferase (TIGR00027 family)